MSGRFTHKLTIRAALVVGFGLTLSLWLFAGYQVMLRVSEVQREAAASNGRYLQAQELLASVRTQVLVASVIVRDALLDPEPGFIQQHRADIAHAYDIVDGLLAKYVPFLDSAPEREQVNRLRDEIQEFRIATNEVLATDSSRWPSDARVLLRRFMPKREAAMRVSEEVQALNRSAFVDEQRKIADLLAGMQRQLWTIFGIALAISLAIAWSAFRHATRLGRRLSEQHLREERITGDLQRLSARLVRAQEDEERRIARELHDEVGQALSAVKVELAVAERKIERATGAAGCLSDAQAIADSALRTVRDLSHWLHPSALEDLGLVAALESRIAEFRRRHSVAIDFVHEGFAHRQPAETERAAYRIVQEALTNIARHAHATSVRISLEAGGGRLRIVVEDDGIGFDVADAERPGKRRGLGLLGIRERVAQLRGRVTVESSAARGTYIEVELPDLAPPDNVDTDTEYAKFVDLVRGSEAEHHA